MQNTSRSACPILQEDKERPVYNVYNQITDGKKAPSLAESYSAVLDPKNNMPVVPNQMPAVGQRQLLSTEREQSTIPKGGTDGTWAYPSAQMFYNGAHLTVEVADVFSARSLLVCVLARLHTTSHTDAWAVLSSDNKQLHQELGCVPKRL
jgi:hypothetical protein